MYNGEEHECYIDNNNKDDYIERLIAEVFVRESLWNSTLPYKLRSPANMKTLWSEVDACLGKIIIYNYYVYLSKVYISKNYFLINLIL